jgi:hypothetical protein
MEKGAPLDGAPFLFSDHLDNTPCAAMQRMVYPKDEKNNS